jgi:hypothetical protein
VSRRHITLGLQRGFALLGTLLLLAAPLVSAGSEPAVLYPDLQTLPPSDLYPDTIGFGLLARHVVRFTNTVVNAGAGPLELRGDPVTGQLVQRLYDDDGGFVDRPLPDADFVFHAEHGHWHLGDFARYDLWRAGEPAGTNDSRRHARSKQHRDKRHGHEQRQKRHGDRHHPHKERHRQRRMSQTRETWYPVHAGRSKASFCVRDTDRVRDETATPAEPVYLDCERDIQGLSPGWGDTYPFGIADQWIDVGPRPLPDGRYVLRSVADPRDLLDEGGAESEASNARQMCFTVTQGQVQGTAC